MKVQGSAEQRRRFIEILELFHSDSRALARRICRSFADGDDLYQEAVLRAFERFSQLRDETRFRSWFYSILLSVHRNRFRFQFWRRFTSLDHLTAKGADPVAAETHTDEVDFRVSRVQRALDSLPAVQRQAIVLFEVNEFSIEEIAEMQRASISAVKSRLSRARERLRRYYRRQFAKASSGRWVDDSIAEVVSSPHAYPPSIGEIR
jgi:RNA polymerase sigma-70 factor (ECF subfamily)